MLLEMMHHYGTLEQGKWSVKEAFEYRFNKNEEQGLYMCLARFRGGLFTAGFAVSDVQVFEKEKDPIVEDVSDSNWIKPTALLGMMNDEQFKKRA